VFVLLELYPRVDGPNSAQFESRF